ncbi:DUF1810 domain-containing protein [Sphingomonas solaris]|uniref:DUF1810 domain-containing protein n=1 Tax=Alterirhizorhabdus solaris TaxID=2529389 RepID=A0A558R9H8_9SPHN|nr:DUF1810 domain-containing protein [Sphingomonas solaris]TVV76008.1 DUF1810 domain-containing protein [Sphingomonas solaris]
MRRPIGVEWRVTGEAARGEEVQGDGTSGVADRHDLDRFVTAQAGSYATALNEIRRGAKRSHWMWYVFPQIAGLGHSAMAQLYAIASLDEACAYLDHPVLGARYRECVAALQDLDCADPVIVFGEIDAAKLRSSLTLFHAARGERLFEAALQRWFGGMADTATLARIGHAG